MSLLAVRAYIFARMDDRTLLDTFARARDDAAFATIVARYGPMVMDRLRRHCRGDAAAALVALACPSDAPFVFRPTADSESIAEGTLTMMKHVVRMKVVAASALTLALVAGVVVAQTAGAKPQAADVPTGAPATRPTSPIEQAWNDLAEAEPKASIALLKLAGDPDAFVAFAKDKFPPVTLTVAELADQLVALGSNDEATWHAASEHLRYFDPRLAVKLKQLMNDVSEPKLRSRLVEVLSSRQAGALDGQNIGFRGDADWANFFAIDDDGKQKYSFGANARVDRLNSPVDGKPGWTRVVRGMVLLEHIGTPAARAIVDAMATGHPDAQPTRVARALIAARTPGR